MKISEYEGIIPKISPDVEIQMFDNSTYLVYHTSLGYHLRVNKFIVELLNLIDGKRSITVITDTLSEKLNQKLTDNEVYNQLFKSKLSDCGIVETDTLILPKKADNYIILKLVLIKAHQFSKISKLFGVLFTPKLFYALLALSLFYLIAFISIVNDLQLYRIFTNSQFINFYLFILLGIFFHELGHAAACSKFGIKHGQLKKLQNKDKVIFNNNYGLLIYGLINWAMIVLFFSFALRFNFDAILFFPYNLYLFFSELIHNYSSVNLTYIQNSLIGFIVPIMIYYMLIRWAYKWINH